MKSQSDDIFEKIKSGEHYAAIVVLDRLIDLYPHDVSVARLASIAMFKVLSASKSNGNEKVARFVIGHASKPMSDPVLNSYAYGMAVLSKASISKETLGEIQQRATILSQGIFDSVLEVIKNNER